MSSALSDVRRALHDNALYVFVVGAYVISGAFILRSVGYGIPYRFADIYRTPVVLTLAYLGLTLLAVVLLELLFARRRPGDPETWRHVYSQWLGTRRLAGTLVVLATLPALLDVMLGYRMALTELKPFTYDRVFMEWDRWLHFGRHPWEILQPLLGHTAVTFVVDRGYVYGWFSLLWLTTIWQAVHGREPIRFQYFLSFALSWILLGTLGAIAFSSAGPVYFERVTGVEDPYAPLMTYLASVNAETPLWALGNQERLWQTYRTWGGITAMPSMHLAITTVAALAAVRTHGWLVVVVGPIWLLMLLGSVHLGWHYAIDSYAGILAAGLIWYGCGRVARWWMERRHETEFAYQDG